MIFTFYQIYLVDDLNKDTRSSNENMDNQLSQGEFLISLVLLKFKNKTLLLLLVVNKNNTNIVILHSLRL